MVLLPLAVVAFVSLGLLGPVAAAAADPPVREEFSVEVSGPHFLSELCGTPILQEGIPHVSSTEYSDGRVIEQIGVDLQLTANGKIAFEQPAFTALVDPDAGTVTLEGTLVNIYAPRCGTPFEGRRADCSGPGHVRHPLVGRALDDTPRGVEQSLLLLRGRTLTGETKEGRGDCHQSALTTGRGGGLPWIPGTAAPLRSALRSATTGFVRGTGYSADVPWGARATVPRGQTLNG